LIRTTDSETGPHGAPDDTAHAPPQIAPATAVVVPDQEGARCDAGSDPEKKRGHAQKRAGGHYFVVCPLRLAEALRLGIKPALAYLVLARGREGLDLTTPWGVAAIERYGLMGRRNARAAVEKLEASGLISARGHRNSRKVRTLAPHLSKEEKDLLYLPNRLIGAVPGDISPLKPLSEMDEATGASALALLMEMYRLCHLLVDHGCNPSLISARWPLKYLGEGRGAYRIYGIEQKGTWHYHPQPSPLPIPCREAAPDILNILDDLHLLRVVKYAFTHPPEKEGEMLFPACYSEGEEAENAYGQAHSQAAWLALERTAKNQKEKDKLARGFRDFVAVRRHISAPLLVGLVRPRWMQDTSHSRQWLAKLRQWEVLAEPDAKSIHQR
jgi:hypothetical protein